MAQQTINVGTAPNDGTGTPLRTAFQYTNSNFTELYTATGPSGNNINVPGAATITGNLTAAAVIPSGSTVPTNGLYLPTANNLGFAYNSTLGMTLNSTGLGVGVSPDFEFAVSGAQAVPDTTGSSTTNGSLRIGALGTGLCIDSGVTAAADVYGWIQARSRTNYATNFNLILNPNGGNVGIGFVPGAGGFSKVLFIGTGTEPTAGATGAVQYFTSTRSANNTIPAILCEGSGVTNAGITSTTVTHKIAMKVNGTIYYLLATTSAA